MLKRNGVNNTIFFTSAQEAINYLDREAKSHYFILLDLNMPQMNGWDFLEACQKRSYADKIFVAIVTSSLIKADMEKAKKYPQVIKYYKKVLSLSQFEEIAKLQQEIPELNFSEKK